MTERAKQLVIVRGGGDIATGTIHRLYRCGYPVLVLESGYPSAIRRCVAFPKQYMTVRLRWREFTLYQGFRL